jgi:hypothetical protein
MQAIIQPEHCCTASLALLASTFGNAVICNTLYTQQPLAADWRLTDHVQELLLHGIVQARCAFVTPHSKDII